MLHSKQRPIGVKKLFSCIFVAAFMLAAVVARAQTPMPNQPQQEVKEDFSQDELKLFIDANKEVTDVQRTSEEKMVEVIEEEGLDIQKFNEILTSQQNPEVEPEASENEMNKFNTAVQKVMKVQQDMQSEVQKAIEDSGMSLQKYDEILLAYQQSPKVQQEVNKILQGEQ